MAALALPVAGALNKTQTVRINTDGVNTVGLQPQETWKRYYSVRTSQPVNNISQHDLFQRDQVILVSLYGLIDGAFINKVKISLQLRGNSNVSVLLYFTTYYTCVQPERFLTLTFQSIFKINVYPRKTSKQHQLEFIKPFL